MAGPDEHGPAEQLDRLAQLDANGLRAEWRRLYRSQPPSLSRDLLVRALAYRIQEVAKGGLPKATLRRLTTLAEAVRTTGEFGPSAASAIRPGARLVREWHGRTYTVMVTERGFEHEGRTYRSLSEIARLITGARWSGPRFFKPLRRQRVPAQHVAARRD